MTWFSKIKNKKTSLLIFVLMSVFVFYGIFNITTTKTAAAQQSCTIEIDGKDREGVMNGNQCTPKSWLVGGSDPKYEKSGGLCSKWNIFSYVSIQCIVVGVNWTIGFLAGVMIMFVMTLLEYALYLNSKIFALPAVQLGWNFTRDIANMGFVLGIIIIAFATILRSQSYGVKQLMVKLIIAAVCVNLSLSIAGVFMDLAGIPSQFFIDEISKSGEKWEFSSTLAAAFNINNINEINGKLSGESFVSDALSVTSLLASVFFSLIFSFIILVTLIALTSMFLYRFITLAILIILMPLAILTWVFPGSRGNWGSWLKSFLNWTFFAPISLFFLFLAVYSVRVQGKFIDDAVKAIAQPAANGPAQVIQSSLLIGGGDPVLLMANMVLMVLMTMGGLFAAQKMSITGAETGMAWAKWGAQGILKGGIKTPAISSAAWAGRKAYGLGAAPAATPGGTATASYASRLSSKLASVRVLGPLLSGTTQELNKLIKNFQEEAKKQQTLFNDGNKAYRVASFDTSSTLTDDAKASGLLLSMAKNGEIRDLNAGQKLKLESLFEKLVKTNSSKAFAQYLPEYAKALGLEIKKIMPTAPADAYAEMKPEVFKSDTGDTEKNEAAKQAVLYSSSEGLRALGGRGDAAAAYEIMRTLDTWRDKFLTFDETARTAARTAITAGAAPTATDTEKVAGKDARDQIEQYQRFESQRNFLYNDPNFSGHANEKDLDDWRIKRRAAGRGGTRRRGGGGTP
ncbi:MAG: hypothetical protein Q8L47_05645 [bacterium]|nr:hypothetical protein [bacterium]